MERGGAGEERRSFAGRGRRKAGAEGRRGESGGKEREDMRVLGFTLRIMRSP